MKYFIASDIHGSAYYCKKLLERFKKEGGSFILLGDILYHGPRNDLPKKYNPKKVIEMLNQYASEITCVKGNCDAEVDQMVLKFTLQENYLQIDDGEYNLVFSHGHCYNDKNPPKDVFNDKSKLNILINGHYHFPFFKAMDGLLYAIVGSVSIPKENSKPSYAVLENKVLTWKNLDGKIIMQEEL